MKSVVSDPFSSSLLFDRGGTESTRHAIQLINALIQDPAKELEDLIPRNHIRPPGSKAGSAAYSSSSGANSSSSSAGPKGQGSSAASASSAFQPSSAASQIGGKVGKGLSSSSSGMRQPFPVSLPLAYAHPQLALLAAQTMQQIRHPRLPMAQFGGTFSPAASTWGPFPVRPVSPGSNNSSPKHGSGTIPSSTSRPTSSSALGEQAPANTNASTSPNTSGAPAASPAAPMSASPNSAVPTHPQPTPALKSPE